MNNDKAQEFVITVWREESNQVEDLDTGLRHSDTDLDTGLRHFDTDLDTELRHYSTDLDTKRVTLTNKEKDIVNFCSVPRTTKEILDRIGVSMHSKNRERYILISCGMGCKRITVSDIAYIEAMKETVLSTWLMANDTLNLALWETLSQS